MFNKSNFCHIASNNRNEQKGSVFIYKTADTLAQVTQSGYFNEKLIDINVHDLIIHVQYDPVARTLEKSVLIVTERTMDNVETTPILDQTIGDDIDQLGDQVAGIEEKIPGAASAANQLADKAFVNDIKTAIETTIAGINTNISTLNNDLSQTNQNLSQTNQNLTQTNQNLSQTNQNLTQTNQDVDSLQETKQDKATAINYDNITNCITEIPQDIKLELNDGILTLKAGSKVYVPNGSGVFDEVVVASDLTISVSGTSQFFIFVRQNGSGVYTSAIRDCFSGATQPTVSSKYAYWYDTTNNVIKFTSNTGSTWTNLTCSLPVAIANTSSGVISSIDQVFNGFGYIGSTVFALRGVKGLIPDGRNEDGSLKNTEIAINTVQTLTPTSSFSLEVGVILESTARQISYCSDPIYNEAENLTYDSTTKRPYCQIGKAILQASKITAFTLKTAFHAVDYNDTEYIAHQAMPSDRYIELTLGASGTIYTAPADGWFISRQEYDGGFYYVSYVDEKAIVETSQNNGQKTFIIPVRKGQSITYAYSNIIPKDYSYFIFLYANGAQ